MTTYTYAILPPELRGVPTPARVLKAPPGGALIRERRAGKVYVASADLRVTSREVCFTGQLVHEDAKGVRLYEPRPYRLTPARAEILERGPEV